MTLQEIENELISLRKQEHARRKNWRSLRKAAGFCGVVFVLGGIGFLAFSIAYPDPRHETMQAAVMFILLSLPMSLLAQALRDPV